MSGFFSMKGRLNRAPYFWSVLVILLVMYSVAFAISARWELSGQESLLLGFVLIVDIGGFILIAFQVVKRLHDLDRPGSHYWLVIIPFYNIYLVLILLFQKGTDGDNQYGPDPLARTP